MKRFQLWAPKMCALACLLALAAVARAGPEKSDGQPNVLLFFGVYTDCCQFDAALKGCSVKRSDARSDRAEYLPTAAELAAFKLVILSDVPGSSLTKEWVADLENYVKNGGSLLVMGGPFALGLGRWGDVGLDRLLPVDLEKFDLKWEKAGLALQGDGLQPLLKGVDLSSKPMLYWIHKVRPRSQAQVVAKAGDYPILIQGTFGQGRVIVFAGTPMGTPAAKQTPLWEWDGWRPLLQNIVNQLMPPGP